MQIENLTINNVRIIDNLIFRPNSKINFIIGKNASGKTSVLEAISVLATTRSFRTDKISKLISYGSESLTVQARITDNNQKQTNIGIRRSKDNAKNIRINFSQTKSREIAKYLTVQAISPKLSDLIFSGSKLRRNFLDWGVFHVKQSSREIFSKFYKILRQRNSLLKNNKIDKVQLQKWNQALSLIGEQLTNIRKQQLSIIVNIFNQTYANNFAWGTLSFNYYKGWSEEKAYARVLDENLQKDIDKSVTGAGPHLADVKIKIDNTLAKDNLSRGEAKLLSFFLRLSQIKYFIEQKQQNPILLLDDICAELDNNNRELVVEKIVELGIQAFITLSNAKQIKLTENDENKMFHMKQGVFNK